MNGPICFGPAVLSFRQGINIPSLLENIQMHKLPPVDCNHLAAVQFCSRVTVYTIYNNYTTIYVYISFSRSTVVENSWKISQFSHIQLMYGYLMFD
jgi:hypothetical protein